MCGRYLVEITEEELSGIVAAAEKNACKNSEQPSFTFTFKGGEIFPGSIAPVITANNEVRFMTWGFPNTSENRPPHTPQGVISSWARPGIHLINARSETAARSKTFSEAMATRRCVVPASGYFEWKTHGKKHKTKYKFTLPNKAPMYMAGVYSIDGYFAVLTRDAVPAIYEIHDRMPVIIPKSLIEVWLKESPDVLKEATTDLQFAPVSTGDKQPEQMSLFK